LGTFRRGDGGSKLSSFYANQHVTFVNRDVSPRSDSNRASRLGTEFQMTAQETAKSLALITVRVRRTTSFRVSSTGLYAFHISRHYRNRIRRRSLLIVICTYIVTTRNYMHSAAQTGFNRCASQQFLPLSE